MVHYKYSSTSLGGNIGTDGSRFLFSKRMRESCLSHAFGGEFIIKSISFAPSGIGLDTETIMDKGNLRLSQLLPKFKEPKNNVFESLLLAVHDFNDPH